MISPVNSHSNEIDTNLNDEQLRTLYAWIDAIPLSRPKKNIARDFSDGVLVAEIIAAYFPSLVELHNYTPAHSVKQKIYNYETLNTRVLRKLGCVLTRAAIEDVVNCKPLAVEAVLNHLQLKMAKYKERRISAEQKAVAPAQAQQQQQHYQVESQPQYNYAPAKGLNNRSSSGGNNNPSVKEMVDDEILFEKEKQIMDLRETVKLLEMKVSKLEQLVRLKDTKIQKLTNGGKI